MLLRACCAMSGTEIANHDHQHHHHIQSTPPPPTPVTFDQVVTTSYQRAMDDPASCCYVATSV
eukprot:2523849-Rhodomonas_salina.4